MVRCNKKGGMNTEVMKDWADSCYRARPGGFFKPKSLLVFDAMTAHKEENCAAWARIKPETIKNGFRKCEILEPNEQEPVPEADDDISGEEDNSADDDDNQSTIDDAAAAENLEQVLNILDQWFPTCGPRAKSGPPGLKKWPSTS